MRIDGEVEIVGSDQSRILGAIEVVGSEMHLDVEGSRVGTWALMDVRAESNDNTLLIHVQGESFRFWTSRRLELVTAIAAAKAGGQPNSEPPPHEDLVRANQGVAESPSAPGAASSRLGVIWGSPRSAMTWFGDALSSGSTWKQLGLIAALFLFCLSGIFLVAIAAWIWRKRPDALGKTLASGFGAIGVIWFVFFLGSVFGGDGLSSTETISQVEVEPPTAAVDAPTTSAVAQSATTTESLATIPGSLGIDASDFRANWNSVVDEVGADSIRLPVFDVVDGAVQDVFQASLSPNIAIVGSVNKADGTIRDVSILTSPTADPAENAEMILAWAAFIGATNSAIAPEARGDVLRELGIIGGGDSWIEDGYESSTTKGGIKYSFQNLTGGLGSLFLSASDPGDE